MAVDFHPFFQLLQGNVFIFTMRLSDVTRTEDDSGKSCASKIAGVCTIFGTDWLVIQVKRSEYLGNAS